MRLIDADKLEESMLQMIRGRASVIFVLPKERAFLDKVVEAPTVEWRKHGTWIIDGHHVECFECGCRFCTTDREGDAIPRDFCPSCGADMR